MKTTLPAAISSIDEAKAFLGDLCKNKEEYHPEDDAHDISWQSIPEGEEPTVAECDQLNKLMADIYKLPGNENAQSMAFDPCEFILNFYKETNPTV